MSEVLSIWNPSLNSNLLSDLLELRGQSFCGLTWMIKSEVLQGTRFKELMTHAEDLLFLIQLAKKGGKYSYTDEPILNYRRSPDSAMGNIQGLEEGYFKLLAELKEDSDLNSEKIIIMEKKIKSILFKSYFSNGHIFKAFKIFFRN
jgi:hypothetical protein